MDKARVGMYYSSEKYYYSGDRMAEDRIVFDYDKARQNEVCNSFRT